MNFTSLEDAFPSKPWPTKSQIHKKHVVEQRDSEKEGRTFPTPQHRGQHAIQKHKKTIDDLTSSLPISKEEEEGNYNPTRIEGGREHYTYEKVHPMDGTSFPYAPPQFQLSSHELKLQKLSPAEIIVVDNHPDSKNAKIVKNISKKLKIKIKYLIFKKKIDDL